MGTRANFCTGCSVRESCVLESSSSSSSSSWSSSPSRGRAFAVIVIVILRIQVSWRHLPMDNGSTGSVRYHYPPLAPMTTPWIMQRNVDGYAQALSPVRAGSCVVPLPMVPATKTHENYALSSPLLSPFLPSSLPRNPFRVDRFMFVYRSVELFLIMIHARGKLPSWVTMSRCDNATNESFGWTISGGERMKAFDTCSRRDHRFSGRKLLGSPRNSPRRVALENFKLLRDDTVTGWRRAILCFLQGEEAEALRWSRRT